MASIHTVSTLPRISNQELSKIILAHSGSNLDAMTAPPHIAIVDVRDDDHIGGHIRHSIHSPSHTLDYKIPELVRKLADKEIVVFHCALSQQRGPSAALRYLRERERLRPVYSVGEVMKATTKSQKTRDGGDKDAEGEWEDVDEGKAGDGGQTKQQEVYVLKDGFVGWQERYGEDTRLTEGYEKKLWQNGYWG